MSKNSKSETDAKTPYLKITKNQANQCNNQNNLLKSKP